MDAETLLNRIGTGASDKVFYRTALPDNDEFSQELAAMSNSSGGMIILGVNEVTGIINGLTYEQPQGCGRPIISS